MPRDYFKATIEYRLQQEFGDRLPEILRDLYEVRGLPIRETMRELGVNNLAQTRRLLEKHGVRLRRGSEAVAHQWKRKPERRHGAGVQRFAAMVRGRAARGEHWARGHTKATHGGLADVSAKLASSGRLVTQDAIERSVEARKRRHRADPSTHIQAAIEPSSAERAFMGWLERTRRGYVFQHPLQVGDDLIFVDFYLPAARLAVEVTKNRGRFPLARARLIVSAGLTPLGIPNYAVLAGQLQHVEQAVALAERGQFNPTTLRECWMSRRSYTCRAADAADLDQSIR